MLFRRFDGRLVASIPPYRRVMPFLMRGRNESAVYFEQTLDLSHALPWLDRQRSEHGQRLTPFHLIIAAMVRLLAEQPRLNRFVSGRRIYQREGIWLSFAVKQRPGGGAKLDHEAPLAVVKRRFEPGVPIREVTAAVSSDVQRARQVSPGHRELDLANRAPSVVLDGAVRLIRALDFFNLAPRAVLERDPMYTSAFLANLGSIGLDAAYHHLYEHGNCPLFVAVGKVRRAPVATDAGAVEVRPVLGLKYTFDERIEDGLYCARALEHLARYVERPETWA